MEGVKSLFDLIIELPIITQQRTVGDKEYASFTILTISSLSSGFSNERSTNVRLQNLESRHMTKNFKAIKVWPKWAD